MKIKILVLGLVLGMLSCDSDSIQNFDFSWLVGKWKNEDGMYTFFETWEQKNDTLYSAMSVMMIGNDTAFSEDIALEIRNNEIYYVPTLNGNETSYFRLNVHKTGKRYEFINSDHDFPQRIVYELISEDSILAFIDGKENGIYRKETFPFKRVR